MYEIWKCTLKTTSHCVRTKVLTNFRCDLDLWTPKCIGISILPSCVYVWNMKAVRWKLLKLSCQHQNIDKVPLRPWPLDQNIYRDIPFAILHLCMNYESCALKTTQVIVSEPKCWQSSIVTLTFHLLTPKCIGIFFFLVNIKPRYDTDPG